MNTIPYARKDFVRVYRPTGDEEYRNTPVSFKRETHAGLIITAMIVGGMVGAAVTLFLV